jgi:hypothetical protein
MAVRITDNQFADVLFAQLAVEPLGFSFPWLSMLFEQSLELQEVLELWDDLLVFKKEIVYFVMQLSAAYLLHMKKT